MKKVIFFKDYDKEELSHLIKIFYRVECTNGQEIINKANPILFFFIVYTGKFRVYCEDEKEEKILGETSIFGEGSIIQKCLFNGFVRCIEDATIFALNKKDYQNMLKYINENRLKDKIDYLKSCDLLSK